jgi:ribose transport system permease protein
MKKSLAALLALAVLLGLCLAASATFRNPANLMNIARQVSYSGIIALGMTLVIAGGGIDLSSGSLVACSGIFALETLNRCAVLPAGAQLAVMLAAALLCGLAGGAVNGALVNWGRIPPFIATLGTLSIFRSLAVYRADAGLVMVDNACLDRLCGGWTPVVVLLVVAGALAHLLRNTPLGWRICAVGASERAAAYTAVSVRRVRFMTYAIIGGLCGASAFLLAGRLSSISSTGSGANYELDAIAAVIIGGTPMTGGRASVWGTLAGVFILGIIANVLDLWSISANLQGTVKGLVIILAVLFQFQKRDRLQR